MYPYEAFAIHGRHKKAEGDQKAALSLLFVFVERRRIVISHPQISTRDSVDRKADTGDGHIDSEVIKTLQGDGWKWKIAGTVVILARKKNNVVDERMKRSNRQIVERRRQSQRCKSDQVGPERRHEDTQSLVVGANAYADCNDAGVYEKQRYPSVISK